MPYSLLGSPRLLARAPLLRSAPPARVLLVPGIQLRAAFLRVEREYKAVTDAEKAEVQALGGLHVVGSERHESRRIDNQLRGRAGRQGDLGSTRYFLSLEVRRRLGGRADAGSVL